MRSIRRDYLFSITVPLFDKGEMSLRWAEVVHLALRVPKNVTAKRTGIGIEGRTSDEP